MGHPVGQLYLSRVLGIDVQILEESCLGEAGLVVDPRAPVAVGAGAHLEEEGAVDLVLLGAEDTRQIFCHSAARPLWLILK